MSVYDYAANINSGPDKGLRSGVLVSQVSKVCMMKVCKRLIRKCAHFIATKLEKTLIITVSAYPVTLLMN